MSLPAGLGTAKPLGYFVDHLDELPGWLYVSVEADKIDLTTECYPVEIDFREVSEEEMIAFEAAAESAGFRSFFCDGQLRGMIANLEQQRANFSRVDLERAIAAFYWRNDAFITLDGDVT